MGCLGERERSDPEGGEKEKKGKRKGKVRGMEKQRRERVK